MELINFQGLNCYYNSIISIAHALGVDFVPAFGTLWSETEFRYDAFHKVCASLRILENLAALGLHLEALPCATPSETRRSMARLDEGAHLVIGMDAFHMPWNPSFGLFSGQHYFVAVNTAQDALPCYDPTYGRAGERLARKRIAIHANDVTYIYHGPAAGLQINNMAEIGAVAQGVSALLRQLPAWFGRCRAQCHEEGERAARYVDALVGNRYLYRYYLARCAPRLPAGNPLDDDAHYSGWMAVKYGLMKAAIARDNQAVIGEVCDQATRLLHRERAAAREICAAWKAYTGFQ